jgi:hypothetical protein
VPEPVKKAPKAPKNGKTKAGKGKYTERECSFCKKPGINSRLLIAGPDGIFICDECVAVCVNILIEEGSTLFDITPRKKIH